MELSTKHKLNTSQAQLRLSSAILLYSGQDRSTTFATLHTVTTTGDQNSPVIGAGKPLTEQAMRRICSVKIKRKATVEILPPNLLYNSDGLLIWFVKGEQRRTFFKSRTIDGVFTVPYPDLLFCEHRGSLYLYAMQPTSNADQRPTMTTVLCHAPLMNIFSNNALCVGNNSVPVNRSLSETISAWQSVIFDSTYTHPNANTHHFTSAKGGIEGLWSRLCKSSSKKFPLKALKPIQATQKCNTGNFTLADLINNPPTGNH